MANILSFTAVAKVFPIGQKVIAAIAECSCEIPVVRVNKSDFEVEDIFEKAIYPNQATSWMGGVECTKRTISSVYVSKSCKTGEPETFGRYIIFEFSPEDEGAPSTYLLGAHRNCREYMKNVILQLTVLNSITAANGEKIKAGESVTSSKTIDSLLDCYHQGRFKNIEYNYFKPLNYDPATQYPLVLFIAESWCLGPDCLVSLAQGFGGTVWAFPEEQALQECFVLVPHFPGPVIAEDDFTVRNEVEVVKDLLDLFFSLFPIDKKRIYYTGQSMGVLAGCELSIRYPKLFSACLMISGFWDLNTMPALKDKNIWFFVSESDFNSARKAEQMIDNMEKVGAKVGRYYWDGNSDISVLNQEVEQAANDGNTIRYTVFKEESVIRKECTNCHRAAWLLVYQLEAVRRWLLSC